MPGFAPYFIPQGVWNNGRKLLGDGYEAAVLALSPVGYWRLGERSGTTAVAEVGPNGTYVGGSAGYTLGVPGATEVDAAVLLKSSGSGYVTIPDNAALDVGDVFSVIVWTKRTTNGDQWIINRGSGSFAVSFQTNSTLAFLRAGVALLAESSVTVTADDEWHMIAVTKNGTTRRVYVDGVDVTVLSGNSTCVNTATPLEIGRGSGTQLNAAVDEVSVFNVALTAGNIAALYAAATT